MSAIDKTDYSLSGIMPVVPRFDFDEHATIEIPAAWEAMAAMYDYEQNIRPIAHEWAILLGRDLWERNKPWYCHL